VFTYLLEKRKIKFIYLVIIVLPMSTNKNQQLFSTYEENNGKILTALKRVIPQYHQSITNIQQEYINSCENFINTAIKLHTEYAKKTGITTTIPEVTQKIVQNAIEDFINVANIQNQVILATIDTAQQNLKTFNDNTKSFVGILQSWLSTFTVKV